MLCLGCGKETERKTPGRRAPSRCDGCQAENRRDLERKRYQKARPDQPAYGSKIACQRCGGEAIWRRATTRHCAPCSTAHHNELMLAQARAERISLGLRVKGDSFICKGCGETRVDDKSGQKIYCDPCVANYTRAKIILQERKRRDPSIALHHLVSRRIRKTLGRGRGLQKWSEILGYSFADLKVHIERQFQPGMSWDNRAEWHVDHIRPLAQFSPSGLDDPVLKEAWALTNLRPMWAGENQRKHAARLFLI